MMNITFTQVEELKSDIINRQLEETMLRLAAAQVAIYRLREALAATGAHDPACALLNNDLDLYFCSCGILNILK